MENRKKKCETKPLKKQKMQSTNVKQKGHSSISPKKQPNKEQPETKDLSKTSSENTFKKGIAHNSFTMLYPKEPTELAITVAKGVEKEEKTSQTLKAKKNQVESKKKLIPIALVQPRWQY